jgi:4-amino-4-deoxy-L-arabinose transferase-like glycosyltransferase
MRRDRNRGKAGLLLAGAVGFSVLGQFYFHRRPEFYWDGIIFVGLALACFGGLIVLAARSLGRPHRGTAFRWRKRLRQAVDDPRIIVASIALLLNVLAARSASAQPPRGEYTVSALLWLTSLALFFIAFVSLSGLLHNVQQGLRNTAELIRHDRRRSAELVLVVALILIGLVLRAWDLGHIPANMSGDEGTQGMSAVDVLEGRLRNPFATGWFTVPTMSFFALAASLRLFGDSVAGLRAISALVGTATLLFTYLFARRNLGRRVALFALAALTFNHYHIHFSRLGSNQIADPFFMILTLLFLTEGLRRTKTEKNVTENSAQGTARITNPWFLAAGLAIGLSWYAYFGSRVIVLVVAAFVCTEAILQRGFLRRNARPLMTMGLMAFMSASPLLAHYISYPANLSARFNQVNVFLWLDRELARNDHDSIFNLVMRQIWRSISAFNHTLDPTFWYRARIPLLDFISGIFFVLGLVAAIIQWRRSHMRLILFWFAFAIVIGWVLTENPPSSMRMLIVAPAVALLAAIGLDRLLTLAQWAIGGNREGWNWVGASILAVAALLNVHYYFFAYTPTRVYGNPSAETATVFAEYLREGSASGQFATSTNGDQAADSRPFVYFYGPPFLYYDFGAIQFIARGIPGINVAPRGEDPDFRTRVLGPTLFVVLSERLDELPAIQQRHPNGELREFYSSTDGRLMFVIYEVPY